MKATFKRFGPNDCALGIILEDYGLAPEPGSALDVDGSRYRVLRSTTKIKDGKMLAGVRVELVLSPEQQAEIDHMLDEMLEDYW